MNTTTWPEGIKKTKQREDIWSVLTTTDKPITALEIKALASSMVTAYPFLLAVAFFFASTLLYSQAATTQALVPAVILALGITPENTGSVYIIIASFAAVSALFVLPTYPTLLGAVQMDDTGSTRIGKLVFNHPFFIPGVLAIAISVALGFLVAPLML